MLAAESALPNLDQVRLLNIREEIFGQQGFSTCLRLKKDELSCLREMVRNAWLKRIAELAPDKISIFSSIEPYRYHEFAHHVPHDRLWTYEHRQFSRNAVDTILEFSVFEELFGAFPGAVLTGRNPPHPDLGRGRVIWRIVRPGRDKDVGPCHADYWFDAVQNESTNYPTDHIPVKSWIPLWSEAGKTGLSVFAGSHAKAWPFSAEIRDGVVKPTFDTSQCDIEETLLEVEAGQLITFSDRLLHRGVNSESATSTRISVEFVLLVPRSSIEHHCRQPFGLDIWTPLS